MTTTCARVRETDRAQRLVACGGVPLSISLSTDFSRYRSVTFRQRPSALPRRVYRARVQSDPNSWRSATKQRREPRATDSPPFDFRTNNTRTVGRVRRPRQYQPLPHARGNYLNTISRTKYNRSRTIGMEGEGKWKTTENIAVDIKRVDGACLTTINVLFCSRPSTKIQPPRPHAHFRVIFLRIPS